MCAEVATLSPFAVNLDWLQLNMRGPMSLAMTTKTRPWRGGLWLQPTEIRTRVFGRVLYVVDDAGEKIMTLWGAPYTNVTGPKDWYQVQFHNRTLYDGRWWFHCHQLFNMGFTFTGVTRIDLAADGLASDGGDFLGVMKRGIMGDAAYYGKALWRPVISHKMVRNGELGSRSSNKFMRCYDKTDEMSNAQHDKPHIRDAWAAALGTPKALVGQAVQRLELQTKNTEVIRHYPECRTIDWLQSLTHQHRRAELYASTVPKMFDFRIPAKRSRDTVPIVEWDWSRLTDCEVEVQPRARRTVALPTNTIKSTCRTLFLIYMASGDTSFLQQVRTMVDAKDLGKWFLAAERRWRVEFRNLEEKGDQATRDLFTRLVL